MHLHGVLGFWGFGVLVLVIIVIVGIAAPALAGLVIVALVLDVLVIAVLLLAALGWLQFARRIAAITAIGTKPRKQSQVIEGLRHRLLLL